MCLDPRYANRHGPIAGATGTGKTITLQVMAESFSRMGVPVFVSDVKGDLSGISQPGSPHPKIDERVQKIGITDFHFAAAPTVFWDLFGVQGHPIRATISDSGPLLFARLLDLNRESAHELRRERAEKAAKKAQARDAKDNGPAAKKTGRRRQSLGEAFIKSLARTVGNQIGRQLMRGILGSLKR